MLMSPGVCLTEISGVKLERFRALLLFTDVWR